MAAQRLDVLVEAFCREEEIDATCREACGKHSEFRQQQRNRP